MAGKDVGLGLGGWVGAGVGLGSLKLSCELPNVISWYTSRERSYKRVKIARMTCILLSRFLSMSYYFSALIFLIL